MIRGFFCHVRHDPEITVKKTVRAALALVALCTTSLACAQTSSRLDEILRTGKLRVCTPGDYKPFSLAKSDGSYEGIDIDLMQSAFASEKDRKSTRLNSSH